MLIFKHFIVGASSPPYKARASVAGDREVLYRSSLLCEMALIDFGIVAAGSGGSTVFDVLMIQLRLEDVS